VASPQVRVPTSSLEAELLQQEDLLNESLLKLRRSSANPLEAQEKIDDWAHTKEGSQLLAHLDKIRQEEAHLHQTDTIVLDEPANATANQLRALDLHEEMIRKVFAIQTAHPGIDTLVLQKLIDQDHGFFTPRRAAFAEASKNAALEELRLKVQELREKIRN
jgi:hypothetical protein